MKTRKHLIVYLFIIGGGLLIFLSHNDFRSSTSETSNGRSLEDVISFHSAATGDQFSGKKIRTFDQNSDKFQSVEQKSDKIPNAELFSEKSYLKRPACDKWGVMTTISSPPSEAVRRFLYMTDWCVVVVSDFKKPEVRND